MMTRIDTLLIANRGEIAVRIARSARSLGIKTVAVYSEPDAGALHRRSADVALPLNGKDASQTYLDQDQIIEAARRAGAQAIHPGYGFLSENAEFAERCRDEGFIFVGPPADAVRLMGSKRHAKAAMLAAGVPCIPGYQGEDQSDEALMAQAQAIGFPIMIKASAGGGGRGMRIVAEPGDFIDALSAARQEALAAFGDDEFILERALIDARHIEVQVFADQQGNTLHLGERDCSIQRRHQKCVEEAPSPFVNEALRGRLGEAAVAAAKACDYVGAGTVEFLVDAAGEIYFLEMNTRLQVEHPVTECITGLDLVAWQLAVAEGRPLRLTQAEVPFNGHAIEVRLCAEDPRQSFRPQSGSVLRFACDTHESLRLDTGIEAGQAVSPYYDSMVGKLIAWGEDRDQALRRLVAGLESMTWLGVHHNKHFLLDVLQNERFVRGEATTAFIKQEFPEGQPQESSVPSRPIALAASLLLDLSRRDHPSPSVRWRTAAPLAHRFRLRLDGGLWQDQESVEVLVARSYSGTFYVRLGEESFVVELDELAAHGHASLRIDGASHTVSFCRGANNTLYLDDGSAHYGFVDITYDPTVTDATDGGNQIIAPMDGMIVQTHVAQGDAVRKGDVLAVLEAMKMAHPLTASCDGVVGELMIAEGDQVKTRQLLMILGTHEEVAE